MIYRQPKLGVDAWLTAEAFMPEHKIPDIRDIFNRLRIHIPGVRRFSMTNDQQTADETRRANWLLGIIVIVLFLLISLYIGLHMRIPASGVVSPVSIARDEAVRGITQATDILTKAAM